MITHRAFTVVQNGMTEEGHFKRIQDGQWVIPYLTREEAERVCGSYDAVHEVEITFRYVDEKTEAPADGDMPKHVAVVLSRVGFDDL